MISLVARHRLAIIVLATGLALRLALAFVAFPGAGYAGDLGQFWQWAQALAANGPGSFYATVPSANYPPLYLYVLWALGAIGSPDLLKLPPILADIGIAAIVYAIGRRAWGERVGLLGAALFLFLPVSWYDSALWGQVDAVGTLIVLAALVLLLDGWSEAALALAVLAVLVKPQYAIGLGIVLPVLIHRHVIRPGSGPVPAIGPRLQRFDDGLGGVLGDQGPRRLLTSGAFATLAAILVLLPFDIAVYAPTSLANVPVIGQVAGLAGLLGRLGSEFSVLTANAFNAWALVGSPSLAQVVAGSSGSWLPDSLPVLGAIPAVTLGALLLAGVALLIAIGLLIRDGLVPIMLGFTILALAFFVLPTRVHERYLFPFFATGALLAAPGLLRVAGLALMAILNALNLHAVLAGNLFLSAGGRAQGPGAGGAFSGGGPPGAARGGFGSTFGRNSFSSISLPWGDLARSEIVVAASALGLTVALVALIAAWVVIVLRPGWAAFSARRPATSPS